MSETRNDDAFAARMAVLGDRFRERSLADASELERLGFTIDQAENAEAAETIRRIAHRLSGSAGTFGFPDLSEAAGQLEEVVLSAPPSSEVSAETSRVVAKIRQVFEAA